MASPVPKFPIVIENLKKQNGYKSNLVTTEDLETELIRITGSTRDQTISNHIRIMEKLGLIHRKIKNNIPYWCLEKCTDTEDTVELEDKYLEE